MIFVGAGHTFWETFQFYSNQLKFHVWGFRSQNSPNLKYLKCAPWPTRATIWRADWLNQLNPLKDLNGTFPAKIRVHNCFSFMRGCLEIWPVKLWGLTVI
jgi:hypothetical protein